MSEYFSEPGYCLVDKVGNNYHVTDYLGETCCTVTVTTDNDGIVLCASPELRGRLDGLKIKKLRSVTANIEIPVSLADNPRCLFPELDIQLEYVTNGVCLSDKNMFYAHGVLQRNKVVGYGGVVIRPSGYTLLDVSDVVRFYDTDIRVVPRNSKMNRCSFGWIGAGKYTWQNVNIIINDYVEEGGILEVDVPDKLLGVREVIYYPYGPGGEKYFEIIQSDDESSAVEQAIQQEVLRNFVNPSVPKGYIDAVKEILANAPSAYKNSEDPILAALGWALAERKGR